MCILFVDDEPMIALVAEEAFTEAAHEVLTAGSAAAAIDLIARHPGHFTCLVTDLHMPGVMTGIDLVEYMREAYPTIPIVLTTGRPDAATPEWRTQYRVELLEKPYSPERLIRAVERLLFHYAPLSPRKPYWNARSIELEGEVAQERLTPRWQNPYVFGSAQHDAWADGWDKTDGDLPGSPS